MTDDRLLTTNDQAERISMAYAHAVAARAGYTTATYSLDRHGIDLLIQAGGHMLPALALQMKATINLRQDDAETFLFRLPIRNYNLLRKPSQTPQLLVVLDLPRDEQQWLAITEDELVIRNRAYWKDLRGYGETSHRERIPVGIPRANLFDVAGLRYLMEQSRRSATR